MKKTSTLLALLLSTSLLLPTATVAMEDTANTSAGSNSISGNAVEARQAVRAEAQALRAESVEAAQARAEAVRAAAEERRQDLQAELEARRQEIQNTVDARRDQLEERVEDARERVQESRDRIAARHAERLTRRFTFYGDKLAVLISKLQERSAANAAQGVDVSGVDALIDQAESSLETANAEAQAAISGFENIEVDDQEAQQAAAQAAVAKAEAARAAYKTSLETLRQAAELLRSLVGASN